MGGRVGGWASVGVLCRVEAGTGADGVGWGEVGGREGGRVSAHPLARFRKQIEAPPHFG